MYSACFATDFFVFFMCFDYGVIWFDRLVDEHDIINQSRCETSNYGSVVTQGIHFPGKQERDENKISLTSDRRPRVLMLSLSSNPPLYTPQNRRPFSEVARSPRVPNVRVFFSWGEGWGGRGSGMARPRSCGATHMPSNGLAAIMAKLIAPSSWHWDGIVDAKFFPIATCRYRCRCCCIYFLCVPVRDIQYKAAGNITTVQYVPFY